MPYRLGGADPGGFDCSGLVQYIFAQYRHLRAADRRAAVQIGDTIRPAEIKPGDLIFFNTNKRGDGASHVAIAIGQDSFVHAPNSTGVVRIETLGSAYWGARYVGARRDIPFVSDRHALIVSSDMVRRVRLKADTTSARGR